VRRNMMAENSEDPVEGFAAGREKRPRFEGK
jgi:hypothetical protein